MKHSPYDDNVFGDRHTGRPPLPADAIYRRQHLRTEILKELDDDDALLNYRRSVIPANAKRPSPKTNFENDDQAGDDEDAYNPITLEKPQMRNP